MMRYLDKYAIYAASAFESELLRVSEFDEFAEKLSKSNLINILFEIKSGNVFPPSEILSGYKITFLPDDKYSPWASKMYWKEGEKALFTAAADLMNVMTYYKNDFEFSIYCKEIGYEFDDGWPNNSPLLPDVEPENIEKHQESGVLLRIKKWYRKVFDKNKSR